MATLERNAACSIFSGSLKKLLNQEFANQPLQPVTLVSLEAMEHLPEPVKKYLIYTRAVGQAVPQNMFISFEADMFRKPGDAPMKSKSEQYNFFSDYTRIFLMKANKAGIPFRARHIYSRRQASFRVRVAGMFNVVDIQGDELTRAETVTFLNDLCIFAPGFLTDKRLSWKAIDPFSCEVSLNNGKYQVSATLHFNTKAELVNFVSDDRSALQDDGKLKKFRWSTPVSDYQEFDGRKIPTTGKTIWHYPDEDFTYGIFHLKNIQYNLKQSV